MLELDHAFCLLAEPARAIAAAVAGGLTLDEGMAHPGQGTRNRRVLFARDYFELLWIERPAEAATNVLRLDRRLDEGCPFGFALRTPVDEALRRECFEYPLPGAAGASLWIHRSNETDPHWPLVFAFDAPTSEAREQRWPARRLGADHPHLSHPGGAHAIGGLTVRGPGLDRWPFRDRIDGVRAEAGADLHLTVTLDGHRGAPIDVGPRLRFA